MLTQNLQLFSRAYFEVLGRLSASWFNIASQTRSSEMWMRILSTLFVLILSTCVGFVLQPHARRSVRVNERINNLIEPESPKVIGAVYTHTIFHKVLAGC
jgi:hypothetical protein